MSNQKLLSFSAEDVTVILTQHFNQILKVC